MNKPGPHIILKARGITKEWPGVRALDQVDFNVYAGAVNALVGENGAGKSTLMNILSGTYPEYDGEVFLDGRKIYFLNTAEAGEAGVAMIHQELNLVPYLSIAENMYLGREPKNVLGLIDYKKMHKDAAEVLARLEFKEGTHKHVCDLRVGQQQMVEIAKALSLNARVLIMDEPTSSLSEKETQVLFGVIESLTAKGVGIVYITHKMDELARLADYVTVLRDGKLISETQVANTTTDEIVRLMVGRERKDFFVKQEHPKGEVLLEVCDISLRDAEYRNKYKVDEVCFDVRAGEVLGLYGLMGAGRSEIFEAIFGAHASQTTGSLKINGKSILPKSPGEAIKEGIALIPEDRKCDGLVLDMDISQNITLASLQSVLRLGTLYKTAERKIADMFRNRLTIKSHSHRQKTGTLSGGNQQKVVLSKWLLTDPQVLLLDEPTRGIDINAKNEIYKLMDELAAKQLAIVVISSELPEIMAVSDRIITVCNGRITGEFSREEFTEERILKASLPDNQTAKNKHHDNK